MLPGCTQDIRVRFDLHYFLLCRFLSLILYYRIYYTTFIFKKYQIVIGLLLNRKKDKFASASNQDMRHAYKL